MSLKIAFKKLASIGYAIMEAVLSPYQHQAPMHRDGDITQIPTKRNRCLHNSVKSHKPKHLKKKCWNYEVPKVFSFPLKSLSTVQK